MTLTLAQEVEQALSPQLHITARKDGTCPMRWGKVLCGLRLHADFIVNPDQTFAFLPPRPGYCVECLRLYAQ